jgi:DNA-binding NtrC family response regulator
MAPPGGSIVPDHLSPALAGLTESMPLSRRRRRETLGAAVEKLEREMIRAALGESGGNISETARTLGLTRRGLYLKLQRLGIPARV